MSITINVQLLSGEVLKFQSRARNGSVKYMTVAKRIHETVLLALSLDSAEHIVKLLHDDDEERMIAVNRQIIDNCNRKFGRPEAKEEDCSLDGWHEADKMRLQDTVDKARVYHDGDIVHAIVKSNTWADLEDSDSDME